MTTLHDKIGNFTVVPNSVIQMWPKIGDDAMGLFLYLQYRTNAKSKVAYPSYAKICVDTRLTRRRIARAIEVLESADLVNCQKRFGRSTRYTLKYPALSAGSAARTAEAPQEPVVQHLDQASSADGLSAVQQVHTNKMLSTKKERTISEAGASGICTVDGKRSWKGGPTEGKVVSDVVSQGNRELDDKSTDYRAGDPSQDVDGSPDGRLKVTTISGAYADRQANNETVGPADPNAKQAEENASRLSETTRFVLALARATAVADKLSVNYGKDQEQALYEFELAYSPQVIQDKANEMKANGERGKGLINHLINFFHVYNPNGYRPKANKGGVITDGDDYARQARQDLHMSGADREMSHDPD